MSLFLNPRVITLAALSSLAPFAIDTYLPAFHILSNDLLASPEAIQQSLTFYLLPYTIMLLFHGPISDGIGRIKTINRSDSSYSLKHIIEDLIGEYVSNGECIKAFIELGFNAAEQQGGLNALNIRAQDEARKTALQGSLADKYKGLGQFEFGRNASDKQGGMGLLQDKYKADMGAYAANQMAISQANAQNAASGGLLGGLF